MRFLLFITGGIGGIYTAKEFFFTLKEKIIWKFIMGRLKNASGNSPISPEQIAESALFQKCAAAFFIGGICTALILPALLRKLTK